MSEFRDLQAKLVKIDESYMSRLAAAVDDIALYNKSMPDEELIALVNTELGDVAAEYMREKLASGESVEEGTFRHEEDSISKQVSSLLSQGKYVISRIPSASGVIYNANPEDGTIVVKDETHQRKNWPRC